MQNYGRGLEPKGLKEANAQPALELPEVGRIDIGADVDFDGSTPYTWTYPASRNLRVRYDADGKRLIIERV